MFYIIGFTPPHTCKELTSTSLYDHNTILEYNISEYNLTYHQCSIELSKDVINNSDVALNLPCINGYDYLSEGDTIVSEVSLDTMTVPIVRENVYNWKSKDILLLTKCFY